MFWILAAATAGPGVGPDFLGDRIAPGGNTRSRGEAMGNIKDIDKGNGEVIRIEISEFKGQQYLNIRTWYTDKEGNLKPTQKGVTVKPELFKELQEALKIAEPEIQRILGESQG